MASSNLNKWNYQGLSDVCYGEEIVYQKAAAFLGDTVEDWGCGMGWARYYFPNYTGLDGSLGFVTKITDLTTYRSNADNILIRQVLEHSSDWKKILQNALLSFQKKLCITIHTPISETLTNNIVMNANNIPDISFKLSDITGSFQNCTITTEVVPTRFEYGSELIIYITKNV